jgi:integrase
MASIRKRRDKWQVQIRRKGRGALSRSFHILKDAEEWARHMEVLADRGELPADPATLRGITLSQLVKRYRDTVSPRKRTHEAECLVLNAFLRHPICRRPISDITAAHFAAYRDERLKEIKPASIKRALVPIRNLYEVARNEWDVPIRENPLSNLKLDGTDERRERRLRPGEQGCLLDATRQCRNSFIAPIITLALETAMRRGEILALRAEHIDLDKRTLLIPESKNGRARTIPLSIPAAELLSKHSRTDERLFPITANAFRLAWERVKRRAGIDDLHFHDLRHEAISRFFEKSLSVPEVALISGHRDLRMLLRYTHPMSEAILKKLDSNDRHRTKKART